MLSNLENKMPIRCQICDQEFKSLITNTHLKSHDINLDEYRLKYGRDSVSSHEYREKMKINSSGKNNPMYGRTHSLESRKKSSNKLKGKAAWNKGIPMTPEHRENHRKMIEKRTKKWTEEGTHPRLGTRLSDETRKKISKSIKNYAETHHRELSEKSKRSAQTRREKGHDLAFFRGKQHTIESIQKILHSTQKRRDNRRKETSQNWIEKIQGDGFEILNLHEIHNRQFSHSLSLETICSKCEKYTKCTLQNFYDCNQKDGICRICTIGSHKSIPEFEIKQYLESIGIQKIELQNRSCIWPKELDIYLPDHKIAIEYCGLFWHSERVNPNTHYHLEKLESCQKKDIRLITIFEDEWISKTEVVKSRLKSILGKIENRIFARNTLIHGIDSETSCQFLKNYHLQGAGKNKKSYGLFYENELMAVMAFSRPNISKGTKNTNHDVWELNRFAVKNDYNIVGGASKLLKYFIRDENPSKIISYADRRWSDGNLYNSLGFQPQGTTPPNYWYFTMPTSNRIHRFSLRKNKNDNQLLTEWENRQLQGYNRIWDCGSLKFEFINSRQEDH